MHHSGNIAQVLRFRLIDSQVRIFVMYNNDIVPELIFTLREIDIRMKQFIFAYRYINYLTALDTSISVCGFFLQHL